MDYLRSRIESFNGYVNENLKQPSTLSLEELLVLESKNSISVEENSRLFQLLEEQDANKTYELKLKAFNIQLEDLEKLIFSQMQKSSHEYTNDKQLWNIWYTILKKIFLHVHVENHMNITAFFFEYGNIYSSSSIIKCLKVLQEIDEPVGFHIVKTRLPLKSSRELPNLKKNLFIYKTAYYI